MTRPDQRVGDSGETLSVLAGRIGARLDHYDLTVIDHPAGVVVAPGRFGEPGDAVRVAIRAANVALAVGRPAQISIRTALAGHVTEIDAGPGPIAIAVVRLTGGEMLRAAVTRLAVDTLRLAPGSPVQALVKVVAIERFPAGGDDEPGR